MLSLSACSCRPDRETGTKQSANPCTRSPRTILPIVSLVVPFFGLTKSILRILKGNPQKGTTMETIGTSRLSSSAPCPVVLRKAAREVNRLVGPWTKAFLRSHLRTSLRHIFSLTVPSPQKKQPYRVSSISPPPPPPPPPVQTSAEAFAKDRGRGTTLAHDPEKAHGGKLGSEIISDLGV